MKDWRQALTALANGFEPQPSSRATFPSLINSGGAAYEYPRFVAPGVEFGNLVPQSARGNGWHYLAVTLPAPLPHLIVDATSNDRLGSDLPTGVDPRQRISLEGDFDRWFRAYAPASYQTAALYVLTPDVMAALIDVAAGYNVEIVDDRIVFFTSPVADFADPGPWQSVHAVLERVVPRVATKAERYLDERVPGQETSRLMTAIRTMRENPGATCRRPRLASGRMVAGSPSGIGIRGHGGCSGRSAGSRRSPSCMRFRGSSPSPGSCRSSTAGEPRPRRRREGAPIAR
ncbi:hypothetical protein SAMN04489806_0836 [Paramicrobacterium humi]|uniref:Uncharacterized protein n=1 Tax=Paramicrobacterium humi TaxID=640635 RepID=A0A1H4JS23_9MICO|nr:hypothetical protein [Microbacterium humi]SEB49079.1 hypothetical protein SAMN04489806_0836 [Microbacterium humi]